MISTDRPQPPSDFSFHVSNDDPLYVEFNWIPGNDYFSQIIGESYNSPISLLIPIILIFKEHLR